MANGGYAISEVPADRWDADAFYDPDPLSPEPMPSKWGCFLPDVGHV
jgi:acyl transferase domain-containing protein